MKTKEKNMVGEKLQAPKRQFAAPSLKVHGKIPKVTGLSTGAGDGND